MTTWRKEIAEIMATHNENWGDVVGCSISDAQLDKEFDGGWGGHEGAAFTLWTENRVYFPVVYDGAEWVGSVPRNPCYESTPHVGGE